VRTCTNGRNSLTREGTKPLAPRARRPRRCGDSIRDARLHATLSTSSRVLRLSFIFAPTPTLS
jgi:hypothetical protein